MNDDGVNSYTYNIFRYRAILFPYFSVIGISINIHKVLWNDASRKGELYNNNNSIENIEYE